jgi:manganese peroxidase
MHPLPQASRFSSSATLIPMAFKTLVAVLSLAIAAQAATTSRVKCPDGKNTASHAACCPYFALRDDLQANL